MLDIPFEAMLLVRPFGPCFLLGSLLGSLSSLYHCALAFTGFGPLDCKNQYIEDAISSACLNVICFSNHGALSIKHNTSKMFFPVHVRM